MRKFFLFSITFLIMISGVSCNMMPKEKPVDIQSQVKSEVNYSQEANESANNTQSSTNSLSIEVDQNKLDQILNQTNNTNSYDKLITKTVDIDEFIEKCDENPNVAIFSNPTLITTIDTEFGIECLRKTEDNSLYSVHKVKQGGLLYIFYRYHSEIEKFLEIKNWYYIKKNLKYQDFSSVVNGTDIQTVADIDPVTNVYIERAEKFDKTTGIATYHYLEDGILLLSYEYKNGKFVVNGQDYQKDFQVELYIKEAKVELYDGRILEQDRLK